MPELNEKEYLLIQEIARKPSVSQRELSEQTGLSLGMTNLLLRRLVANGYVSVHQLNWQKVRYMLTMRGAIERAKKTYACAARSYSEFKRMTAVIRANVLEEYGRGLREFVIVAPAEIETMIREALRGLELPGASYAYEQDTSKALGAARTIFSAIPVGGAKAADRRIIPILEERSASN